VEMMKTLPRELKFNYEQWEKDNKEHNRREALGYYETLEELLNDKNPIITRHAKGILKEKQK
jgi:hypothetical protein